MDIPGIPDSVPRMRVTDAVRSLGIDPASVGRLELSGEWLYITVYAEKSGRRCVDDTEPVKHVVAIPIVDEPIAREVNVASVTVDSGANQADVGRIVYDAIKKYEGRGDKP